MRTIRATRDEYLDDLDQIGRLWSDGHAYRVVEAVDRCPALKVPLVVATTQHGPTVDPVFPRYTR